MDRIKYLMERYETEDLDVLDCRVPFNYKSEKYSSLTDEEYITMIDEIEEIEDREVYEILKERGII